MNVDRRTARLQSLMIHFKPPWPLAVAVSIALVLLSEHLVLRVLAEHFYYETSIVSRPILWFVAIQMSAGLVFLALLWVIPRVYATRFMIVTMFIVGLALRLSFIGTTPILEDDFYRYLWDGALVSNGQNAYSHAPADVKPADNSILGDLKAEAVLISERINYPELRTIYPPVAQVAFALAHRIKPWSLDAWRVVLLGFDIVTVVLLLVLLVRLKRSPLWAALYWWNPLVTKEVFNSVHMDVLLLPFLLAVVLFIVHKRCLHALVSLSLAVGVKVWPIMLLPFVLRSIANHKGKLVGATVLFGALVALLLSPLYQFDVDASSGAVAYARLWEANDALFRLVATSVTAVINLIGVDMLEGGAVARCVVAAILITLVIWINRSPVHHNEELCRRVVIVIAALFLLSPTQYPWYYVWLVPFLAVWPVYGLLALTVVLPLYYLKFYFDARNQRELFDYWIVWLEYLPIWILLIVEWITGWNALPRTARTSSAFTSKVSVDEVQGHL